AGLCPGLSVITCELIPLVCDGWGGEGRTINAVDGWPDNFGDVSGVVNVECVCCHLFHWTPLYTFRVGRRSNRGHTGGKSTQEFVFLAPLPSAVLAFLVELLSRERGQQSLSLVDGTIEFCLLTN
ncbi:unnamed protein product, partial [Pylaiella littoralis]